MVPSMRRPQLFALLTLSWLAACQATPPAPGLSFPKSWIGAWQGELRIFGSTGKPNTVPMELQIAAIDDGFQWKIVYGAGETAQVRDYILREVSAARGDYEIDERNSIMLPATYRGGALISKFALGNNAILSTYRRAGDVILYEILAGPRASARTSGGGNTPVVEGYKVMTRQEAVLRRVD
jgi:hypothetical protein